MGTNSPEDGGGSRTISSSRTTAPDAAAQQPRLPEGMPLMTLSENTIGNIFSYNIHCNVLVCYDAYYEIVQIMYIFVWDGERNLFLSLCFYFQQN